ncbi:protein JINGUBANG [Prunus yedoensis var. nudiflora]|uniref:Protein JINGUBANG n=1 Tax=Prunus yedoensis var. nudiflora TaxID=2094558 RepID=A0A314XK75_PRUYE|nr:protein JINGUBANG [Prunus yedoensis var. nudiflora]
MKGSSRGNRIFSEENSICGQKFGKLQNSPEHNDSAFTISSPPDYDPDYLMGAEEAGPTSPLKKSPWSAHMNISDDKNNSNDSSETANESFSPNVLMGSLVREEGHIYSLASSGDLLYTGSDSKNIRIWKKHHEYSGFKSNSGLVKAIIIAREKIFTGHQDGKIRVWRVSSKNASNHRRIGTLPTLKNYIKCSMKPSNYVEVKRNSKVLWIKHLDSISCLSLSEDQTLLYSASWDKTFKVWRVSDFKCLESITAHDDAVNALVIGFDGLVFTGSADGTVKIWRKELQGKGTKHFFSQTLLKQECAVTALAVNSNAKIIYCGSSDGLVNFWEREENLQHGGVLRGHKLAVLCLATAGWGPHLLVGADGHTGPVKCLAVERDNENSTPGEKRWTVYSGSLDKSVKMWRVSEQAPPMVPNQKHQHYTSDGYCVPMLSAAPSFASRGGKMGSRRF